MTVTEVIGTAISRTIENGSISSDKTVIVNGQPFVVLSILSQGKTIKTASTGMSVYLVLLDGTEDDFKVGDAVYLP